MSLPPAINRLVKPPHSSIPIGHLWLTNCYSLLEQKPSYQWIIRWSPLKHLPTILMMCVSPLPIGYTTSSMWRISVGENIQSSTSIYITRIALPGHMNCNANSSSSQKVDAGRRTSMGVALASRLVNDYVRATAAAIEAIGLCGWDAAGVSTSDWEGVKATTVEKAMLLPHPLLHIVSTLCEGKTDERPQLTHMWASNWWHGVMEHFNIGVGGDCYVSGGVDVIGIWSGHATEVIFVICVYFLCFFSTVFF